MQSILNQINDGFGALVGYLVPVLFADIYGIPLIVLTLMTGALVFTFYFGFINVRGFKHSIEIIKGKYDNPNDIGQISHFQALTSALSATIGLGNIAGVAVAVSLGGPGAVFWMVLWSSQTAESVLNRFATAQRVTIESFEESVNKQEIELLALEEQPPPRQGVDGGAGHHRGVIGVSFDPCGRRSNGDQIGGVVAHGLRPPLRRLRLRASTSSAWEPLRR